VKKIVVAVTILFSQACFSGSSYISEIPDFTQTDVQGEASGNGQQYCAPVAVSNSILWLSNDGSRQLDLIKKLASKKYMNTSLKNGTGTTGVLRGVDKIAEEFFGSYSGLEYEGWRKHLKEYSSGVKVPDINKIKSFITRNSAAWVNVGWYTHNRRSNEYQRIGGHWVTLVGAKKNQLIFHDPSPRAGQRFSNEFVDFTTIKNGTLVGRKSGLPTPAKGYISLGNGMHIKAKANTAIIDGVVYFRK